VTSIRPTLGNQPSRTAKRYLSRIARKKIGIETPISERNRLLWSNTPPFHFAAKKPSGIPKRIEKNIAARPSSTVAGNLSLISSVTKRCVAELTPKSSLAVVWTYFQYWT
jgi:hypothetical protein